jgi:hypothetical protein
MSKEWKFPDASYGRILFVDPDGVVYGVKQTSNVPHVLITGADGTGATVEARKQTPTGNAMNVQIGPGDPISNVPVVIEYEHHQVHEGEQHGYSNLTSSLASGSSKDFRINVPAALDTVYEAPHMVFEVITSLEAEAYIYEGMTYTAGNGGTERTSYNRNRLGVPATAATKIFEDPTPATTGTNLWIGLTGSANRAGASGRSLTEWILKPGDYLFRVTSRANGCKILVRFEWYEDLGV